MEHGPEKGGKGPERQKVMQPRLEVGEACQDAGEAGIGQAVRGLGAAGMAEVQHPQPAQVGQVLAAEPGQGRAGGQPQIGQACHPGDALHMLLDCDSRTVAQEPEFSTHMSSAKLVILQMSCVCRWSLLAAHPQQDLTPIPQECCLLCQNCGDSTVRMQSWSSEDWLNALIRLN